MDISQRYSVIATAKKMCGVIENLEVAAMFFTFNQNELENLSNALDDYIDELEFLVKEKNTLITGVALDRAICCKDTLKEIIQGRGDK